MSREKKRTNYFNQNFHFSLNTNERLHNDNIGRCIAQYCYWILQKQKKKKKKRQNAPEDSYILICVFHLVAVAQERYRAMHPYVYMQWLCNV